MVTTKLISWKTMLEALNTVHHSLRNGSRALTNEFRAIWCDGPCNNDVEFMTLYAMSQLGIISKSPVGTKVISTWMITETPSDAMAQMVFNYVFGPETDKAVQHDMDVTEHYKQKKEKYMKYYKVFNPPVDNNVYYNPRAKSQKIIEKYTEVLKKLYTDINNSDFNFKQFCVNNKIPGYTAIAIKQMNLIHTNYKGCAWVYPELPSDVLAIAILEQSNVLQRNYKLKRKRFDKIKTSSMTVVKSSELKKAVDKPVKSNSVNKQLTPGSIAFNIMKAIQENKIQGPITGVSIRKYLSYLPKSKYAQISMALLGLSTSGRLQRPDPKDAVYFVPDNKSEVIISTMPKQPVTVVMPNDNTNTLDKDAMMMEISRLDPKYRTIIELYDIQGKTYNEICDTLGVNLQTVKNRLHHGRIRLEKNLKNPKDQKIYSTKSSNNKASIKYHIIHIIKSNCLKDNITPEVIKSYFHTSELDKTPYVESVLHRLYKVGVLDRIGAATYSVKDLDAIAPKKSALTKGSIAVRILRILDDNEIKENITWSTIKSYFKDLGPRFTQLHNGLKALHNREYLTKIIDEHGKIYYNRNILNNVRINDDIKGEIEIANDVIQLEISQSNRLQILLQRRLVLMEKRDELVRINDEITNIDSEVAQIEKELQRGLNAIQEMKMKYA